MAKVSRDHLTRGVELLEEHVFAPLTNMAAQLSQPSIGQDQTQAGQGVFRLNFSIPHVGARFFMSNPTGLFYIPFCLPPLQESFDANPSVSVGTKTPILTGVSFGFDQRGEAAHVVDRWRGWSNGVAPPHPGEVFISNPSEGFTNYDRVGGVDIKLSIYDKSQHYFHPQTSGGHGAAPTDAHFAPSVEGEVFTTTIGAAALAGSVERENPVNLSGLSVPIDPKKTYVVGFNADGLFDSGGTDHLALVSVQIGLEFKMELVARDNAVTNSAHVQNMPSVHDGAVSGETITITAPAASAVVQADTGAGVSTGMEKIDSRLRHRLWGGYGDFSSTHVGEHMIDNAAYDIIAVPMFANLPLGETVAMFSWFEMAGNGQTYTDRAIIPITHPMTIHHVIATNNFTTATGYSGKFTMESQPPAINKLKFTVGVGIVNGEYSDSRNYTQVALGDYQPESEGSGKLIDFMDLRNFASHDGPASSTGSVYPSRWEQAMFSIPLVRDIHAEGRGAGYFDGVLPFARGTQGRPFFVGEGASGGQGTVSRTNVGNNVAVGGIVPPTGGAEQYIEVRMQMEAMLAVYTGGTFQANYDPADIMSGYGGCWVYIIGKKHMRM